MNTKKMVEITASREMHIAEMVALSINGMTDDSLKQEIIHNIKYVPSIDELDSRGCFSRTARIVFLDIFAEKFMEIVGDDGRFYAKEMHLEGMNEAIDRITGLLEKISIRGIYKGFLDDGSEGLYVIDNLTFKKSPIYLVNGQKLNMEIINKYWGEGVDVLLLGDDIKKQVGL